MRNTHLTSLGVLALHDKGKIALKIEREDPKMSLFTNDMTAYKEGPPEPADKLLELTGKSAGRPDARPADRSGPAPAGRPKPGWKMQDKQGPPHNDVRDLVGKVKPTEGCQTI